MRKWTLTGIRMAEHTESSPAGLGGSRREGFIFSTLQGIRVSAFLPGIVIHAYNPSSGETEAGEL